MDELLDIKDEEVHVRTLSRHLPPGTVPYLLDLFCHEKNYSTGDKDLEEGLGLLLAQFCKPIPIHASFKEIGDTNCISLDEKMHYQDLENCKLVQSIMEFFHQGVRCT